MQNKKKCDVCLAVVVKGVFVHVLIKVWENIRKKKDTKKKKKKGS